MFLSKVFNGYYYLFFTDDLGRRRKVSTRCRHKSEALEFLRNFKVNEQETKLKLERKTVGQFTEDFLKYSSTVHTPKTQNLFDFALRSFKSIVGDIPLNRVGVREIERFLATKKAETSDWTARWHYINLASAFETAKRWNCISENPFRKVEKPKVRDIRPVYFSKVDFMKVVALIEDVDFKELCLCAVSTGLRLSELTALRWCDIDFKRKVLHVQNSEVFTTKSRKNRVVPMTEHLSKMLEARKEKAECALVFPRERDRMQKDYVSKTFKKYIILAGVNSKLHFHSLRHTFASWLVQDGVSLYEVQKLLGHASSSTTEIYSHLQPEQMHKTVNRISLPLS